MLFWAMFACFKYASSNWFLGVQAKGKGLIQSWVMNSLCAVSMRSVCHGSGWELLCLSIALGWTITAKLQIAQVYGISARDWACSLGSAVLRLESIPGELVVPVGAALSWEGGAFSEEDCQWVSRVRNQNAAQDGKRYLADCSSIFRY